MTVWTWVVRRIGRRGAFLAFLTVLDVSYGYALITATIAALKASPDFLLTLHTWGWVWLGVAAVCASGVLMKHDIFQFTVAALLKAVWAGLYADAWFTQPHEQQAWLSAVVWLSFSLTVMLVSGWPEPRWGWKSRGTGAVR